ncbi:MAG TPA: YdeI/OmpD-associated family protein [Anaerolineales bacterium]|nr:YdeI/OmpD-associated family protein [Anaerolineales bacterium]
MPPDQNPLPFASRSEWRAWLKAHHQHANEAWLIICKKTERPSGLALAEAVEEALCYGWIDGKLKSLDRAHYLLRFSPRRRGSVWSVSNIRRVRELIQTGRMTKAGLAKVFEGRLSGQWDAALEREETGRVPPDLEAALRRRKGALGGYRGLRVSRKKMLLHWLQDAKRPETRLKRIRMIVREVAG